MDRVVNYLTLIIVLVFDPLAVILLLGANRIDEIETGNTPPQTSPQGRNIMGRMLDSVKGLKPFKKKVNDQSSQPIPQSVESTPPPTVSEPKMQEPIPQPKKNTYSDDDINKIKQNLSKKEASDGRGFSINIPRK